MAFPKIQSARFSEKIMLQNKGFLEKPHTCVTEKDERVSGYKLLPRSHIYTLYDF